MRDSSIESIAVQGGDTYEPNLAVQIVFGTSSPTITAYTGISNVPGTQVQGALRAVTAISQQVYPEEGRTTLGGLTFEVVDDSESEWSLTDELREQLGDTITPEGIRDKEVRLLWGFDSDFDNFERVATYYVDDVDYQAGVYRVRCRDKTKFLREQLFEPKTIQVDQAVAADDSTINCIRSPADEGFQTIDTTAGWLDGASGTFGWARFRSTGEIFRYTGISGDAFTGCVRGRFNTRPQAIELDTDDPEEIEEFIYLEGPAVWCAKAVMTGIVDDTVSPISRLPDHWHAGIDPDDLEGFDTIGEDLYDPTDLSKGFPVRFTHLEDEDGKAWIESEIYRLIGVYGMTTSEGKIRLKRVAKIVNTVAAFTATDREIIGHGSLNHDLRAVRNNFAVNYNYDGEDLTRRIILLDAESVNRHGKARQLAMDFHGLHTARHTQAAVINLLSLLRDRYAEPPVKLQVKLPWSYNRLEIGDLIRIRLSTLRDYSDVDAAPTATLDRVFEIQQTNMNWKTGVLTLSLFASVRIIPSPVFNPQESAVIADGWYSSIGTDIASLPGYSADSPFTEGTLSGYDFVGHPTDVNDTAAIFYHIGDLVIGPSLDSPPVNSTLSHNVQLRVAGNLTIDERFNGEGSGWPGGVDTDTKNSTSTGWAKEGTDGFLGPVRAGSGMWVAANKQYVEIEGVAEGRFGSVPHTLVQLDDSNYVVSKFPSDLKGSGGAPGGQVVQNQVPNFGVGGVVRSRGGSGGSGGAGLVIVCRGLAYRPSGSIDLSGTQGAAPEDTSSAGQGVYDVPYSVENISLEAGGGGSGTPGALIVHLDGDLVPYPDLNSATFRAQVYAPPSSVDARSAVGTFKVPNNKHPLLYWEQGLWGGLVGNVEIGKGRNVNVLPEDENIWRAASAVHYVPDTGAPEEDRVPAPQSLTVEPAVGALYLTFNRASGAIDRVEIWESVTNDRSFAELVGEARSGGKTIAVQGGATRYYWIRNVGLDDQVSDWYPASVTGGETGQAYSSEPHLADPFMNDKDAWIYDATSGSGPFFLDIDAGGSNRLLIDSANLLKIDDSIPSGPITGLDYVMADVGYGASTGAWRFTEGNSNIDLYPKRRTGPNEFDATQRYGSSPASDDAMYVDVDLVWRYVGGTWSGAGKIYMLTEWYSPDGTTINNDLPLVDLLLDEVTGKTDGEWNVARKDNWVLSTIDPLSTESPFPQQPHYMRHFLRVTTSGSAASPAGYIEIATFRVWPSTP